jgi:indolepyruvate ferredoxin oxidoreductase alpha subunit
MMGNEAIARGAIEAGVDYTSSYPGSPSSEIQETLARAATIFGHHAEWSVNEKVALEACVGVSFAGLRSFTAMKQNGLNVASDVINTVNLSGTKGGIVLVVADDPSAHSSSNEMDSRAYARIADLPLLEPGNIQEAKDMTRYAFELSERHGLITIVRSVTRISHARGNVVLGDLPERSRKPSMGQFDRFIAHAIMHPRLHQKNEAIRQEFEVSEFNRYDGPEDAELVVITSGTGYLYAWEAIRALGLEDEVGVLKLGTTWPMPRELILKHLWHAKEVLVIEEVDPFIEDNVMVIAAGGVLDELDVPRIYGKRSGHVKGRFGPAIGEMNFDVTAEALAKITGRSIPKRSEKFIKAAKDIAGMGIPPRMVAFCAGCPHRASFWVMRTALKLDGRDGVVMGDIGCYSMGVAPTGYGLSRNVSCMGAGIGHAAGMGRLKDMNQPVIALAGDSTFFHSCLPALVHARYNESNFIFIVLDNSATSMTGFQPHPGTGRNALGQPVEPLDIAAVCKGIGVEAETVDPFDFDEAIAVLYDALQADELKVLIFRHRCELIEQKELAEQRPRVYIDPELCLGDECGCMRHCSRVFGCPGLIWDEAAGKAKIDEVVCNRCGLCVKVCPQGAIKIEESLKGEG